MWGALIFHQAFFERFLHLGIILLGNRGTPARSHLRKTVRSRTSLSQVQRPQSVGHLSHYVRYLPVRRQHIVWICGRSLHSSWKWPFRCRTGSHWSGWLRRQGCPPPGCTKPARKSPPCSTSSPATQKHVEKIITTFNPLCKIISVPWCRWLTVLLLPPRLISSKPVDFLDYARNPSQSCGASPAIRDTTVLPVIWHRWTCATVTPARQAGTRFTYRKEMEGWVDLGGWLYSEMVYLSADSHHPSSNPDQAWL